MALKFLTIAASAAVLGTSVSAVATDGFGYWKAVPWFSLTEDAGYYTTSGDTKEVNNTYNDKLGGKKGKYLIGLDSKNKDFWAQKYKLLKGDNVSKGKFRGEKVTDGFIEGKSNSTSLHKVCDEAYKQAETELQDNTYDKDDKFKKPEVWRYCSKGKSMPKTIEEFNSDKTEDEHKETYTSGKFGTTKKSTLLSVKEKGNQWVWDLKNEEFFKDTTLNTGQGYFQKFYKDNSGTRDNSIKDACENAYKNQEGGTGDNQFQENEVIKWCSL